MARQKQISNQRGVAITEVMIAFALLLFIAAALIPALTQLRRGGRVVEFKVACSAIVRAKLQEYLSGSAVDASTADANADDTGQVLTGFQYSRSRMHSLDASGVGPCTALPTVSAPGFRENISNNTTVADTSPTEADGPPPGWQGFQLWVNLRHYNPRDLRDATCAVGTDSQPDVCCPTALSGNTRYQFLRIGDGIQITVTGFIRTNTTTGNGGRSCESWNGLYDLDPLGNTNIAACTNTADDVPNPSLTCSVSEVVYAPKLFFRYYLGNDGHIRNLQASAGGGTGGAKAESIETHFRSIWSTDSSSTGTLNTDAVANIKSFAVSPNNETVYVLKPGSLLQYGGTSGNNNGFCSDQRVQMTDSTSTVRSYYGIPDCPAQPENEWEVHEDVSQIAVDFRDFNDDTDDIIWGLQTAGPNASERRLRKFNYVSPPDTVATAPAANEPYIWYDSASHGDTSLPQFPTVGASDYAKRVLSVFLTPVIPRIAGLNPQLFVVDNTCYVGDPSSTSAATTSFCITAYNIEDSNLSYTMDDLRLQVISISH